MVLGRALVLLAVATCPAAFAQWSKEPTTVFGIPLGGAPSEVRPCPTRDWENVEPACQSPVPYLRTQLNVYGVPRLSFPYTVGITLYDERIQSVELKFSATNFDAMQRLLVDRYGEPTRVENDVLLTRAGARFPTRTVRWTGKHVSITAYERIGSVDAAIVSFSHNDLLRKQLADQEQKNKGATPKF